jgi:hypothetical protein
MYIGKTCFWAKKWLMKNKASKVSGLCFTVFYLTGCANNSALISKEIEYGIKNESFEGYEILTAPELQTSHFRTLFYGYDTVYFRLRATKTERPSSKIFYQLLVDANYGGPVRQYKQARYIDGASYQSSKLDHDIIRCQFFGSMVNSCLYRDKAELTLESSVLEAGRRQGLSLTLGSQDGDYETIELPAQYIDRFLHAAETSLR